jgi:valyl-tRNA synthetase
MVTARDGKKMSKSKGNVVSPLELTEKYGTDALRMGLIIGNTPGSPTALYEEKIKAYKLFANKLWNITRFILTSNEGVDISTPPVLTGGSIDVEAQLKELIREVSLDIEHYRFYLAGEKLYHYVWHTFADVILESCKEELKNGTPEKKYEIQWLLNYILVTVLKLLHPFMPFITEEIWSSLPTENNKALIIESWPTV